MTDLAIRDDQPAEPQSAASSALAVWVDDAIKAHTVNAARQLGREHEPP